MNSSSLSLREMLDCVRLEAREGIKISTGGDLYCEHREERSTAVVIPAKNATA